jgi:hypothetical protein
MVFSCCSYSLCISPLPVFEGRNIPNKTTLQLEQMLAPANEEKPKHPVKNYDEKLLGTP